MEIKIKIKAGTELNINGVWAVVDEIADNMTAIAVDEDGKDIAIFLDKDGFMI